MNLIQGIKDYVLDAPSESGLVIESPLLYESLPQHEDFFAGGDFQSQIPDWTKHVPAYRSQLSSMYCTGYAGASIGSILESTEEGKKMLFSAIELFYRTGGGLKGNYLTSVAKGMSDYLIPDEYLPLQPPTAWNIKTYEANKLKAKPSPQAVTIGKNYRAKSFAVVRTNPSSLLSALTKSPLMIAFGMGDNYNREKVISNPKVIRYFHAAVLLGQTREGYWIFLDSLSKARETQGIRYLAPNYDFTAALSFVDLPNEWKSIQATATKNKFDFALSQYGNKRDLAKEQATSIHFSATIKLHPNLSSLAGSNWAVVVNALAYGGYSEQDLLNHFTSIHRGMNPIFDLNTKRVKN